MGTKLERIAEISATTKRPEFTSLYHLINTELLKQCHRELDGKKAVGIDKVTKEEYGKHLESNIADLVQRLRNQIVQAVSDTAGIHSQSERKATATGNCVL